MAQMETSRLFHRHGGRILSLDRIEHFQEGKGKSRKWFYEWRGRVEWADGTVSEEAHISPLHICHDHGDDIGRQQCNRAGEALNAYLAANGAWTADYSKWVPHT